MKFTDIFINKPVLAIVVSLFILLFGLRSFTELNVRQYPELRNAVVNISTVYYGADADLIQGFITTPLEREVASAEGIEYLSSTSSAGVSQIQAYIRLDQDPNEALTQIAAKVNKMRGQLPPESEDPVIDLQQGQQIAAMYVSFASETLDNNQITDYLTRVVQPKLVTVSGVQRADILGAGTFAMRIWLKPDRMTALQVTASDVSNALSSNNVLAAVGSTKGQMVAIDMTARTDLRNADEFRQLIIREQNGAIVRLGDVADVQLGSESYGTSVRINGEAATFMGIFVSPDANSLDVIKNVRTLWDNEIVPQLPEGIKATIPYDSTEQIQDAIDEVVSTIVEAVVIVIVVIFLFLGSLRSVLIPAVTVPLSLVGSLFLMLLMGFTINLLTLLAMVLAIGIVVDDAIIVLENIHRHIEEGMSPHDAAIKGARELAWPVVAMTTTLVAVYLPIGFQGGLTGVLFTEFAFTLAGSVLLSGVIALTLSPMMCAKMLKPHSEGGKGKLEKWLDTRFDKLNVGYQRRLHGTLETKSVVGVFGLLVLVSCVFLYITAPKEPAPLEDEGFIFSVASADPYSTLDYVERYTEEVTQIAKGVPEVQDYFLFNGGFGGSGGGASPMAMAGFVLKPWSERDRSTNAVLQQELQPKMSQVSGLNIFALVPPSLPSAGGDGGGGEFVIGGVGELSQLAELADQILMKAMESKRFIFLDKDLKIDKPRIEVNIDRDKAASLGIDMRTLAADMAAMLSGGYTNRFAMQNRSYLVIPQVQRSDRLNASDLENYYTRTRDGELIPLFDHRDPEGKRAASIAQALPAAQRGVDHLRPAPRREQGRGAGHPRPGGKGGIAAGLLGGLRRRVAPVQAGGRGDAGDAGTGADRYLPGAVGAVREFPRCADHAADSADGHLRRTADAQCAGTAQRHPGIHADRGVPGHEHQHLYPGRPGDAGRRDLQARHPDRGVRQQAAGRAWAFQARGHRGGGGHPPAPGADDHRGAGVRDDPAADRQRPGCRLALLDGRGDRLGHDHRHDVHPVRAAGVLPVPGARPCA